MYLKRLEIQGFKSFADKVEFEFPSGITAIVGPNGSGKSNVVDSIRWVLGEQSVKNLRGSKMEDVIFAGSTDRRPLGMAQVSLTLDNSAHIFDLDFEEVTVSRRLYRSGESEYLINKRPARLKDIQELFMDTGLGREGLSIISQGKVDEILSLKPEDRRGLIEEAAGIIKYKYRKRESERKLKDTEENLLRVEDIIGELEERVGPLEEQAKKAKEYKEGKEELDKLSLSVEVRDLSKNEEQAKLLRERRIELTDRRAKEDAERAKTEADLAADKFAFQENDKVFQEKQQAFYALQSRIERIRTSISTDEKLLESVKEQKTRLTREIDGEKIEETEQEKTNAVLKKKAEEAEQAYQNQEKTVSEEQKKIEELEESQRSFHAKQEENKNAVFSNMRAQAKNNNTIQQLEQTLSGGERSKEKLDQRLEEKKKELTEREGEVLLLEEQKEEQEKKQKAHKEQLRLLESEIDQRKNEQFQMRKNLEKIQLKWQETQSKAKALRELEEAGEGYQYGVKSVLEQKNRGKLSGIIGTVSQILTVPKELEKAIETAMGLSLQNIITENDEQAQEAIRYLKEKKKGRVTFLPLNTVKGQRAEESLMEEKNVMGLAVDLISFDPIYEQILLHLVGKIWVVRDLQSAVAIGKKRGFRYRMVTLDGELVIPGGALTGGNHEKERNGFLARQRQIAELEEEVKKYKKEMDEENNRLDLYYEKTAEKKEAVSALHDLDGELIREMTRLEEQWNQQKQDQTRLSKELKWLEADLLEQVTKKEEMEQNLQKEREEKINLQKEEERLAKETKEIDAKLDTLKESLRVLQASYRDNSAKLAAGKERRELLNEQYRDASVRFNNLKMTIEKREQECKTLTDRAAEYESNIRRGTEEVKQGQQSLLSDNKHLQEEYKKREQMQEHLSQLEERLKERQAAQQKLSQEKYRLDLQWNQIQSYLIAGNRRLAVDFDATFEEAKERAIDLSGVPNVQRRMQELKEGLDALGEINFTAIEEFDQVTKRLVFLKEQVGDLEKAKGSLNKIIEEMEKIMAKKFAETYEEVNKRFTEVFKNMFGGGQARLELSEPDDYLLTGIEIVAQPPGKKEQVLTLLSGGERAMTAIALLFALLTVKPSPFCILDEIESALDDHNIDRFAQFIKNYSEKTQFLIISHRKGTMEAADVLYGVAMENKGVSRLMSVKLSDYV